MSILGRTLLTTIVIVVSLAPLANAQTDSGEEPDFVLEWMEEATIEVDGVLDEAVWQEAAFQQVELNGLEDPDARAFAQVYMIQNGTHLLATVVTQDAETVTLQFDPTNAFKTTGRELDAIRVGADGESTDLDYDDGWSQDANGCDIGGEGAASTQGVTRVFEIAKPLEGDECDMFLAPGTLVGFRVLLSEQAETFRWPADTEMLPPDGDLDTALDPWGVFLVEGAFGSTGTPVPLEPEEQEGDPGLFTDERPGIDPNVPVQPVVDEESGAYDSTERTSAPSLAVIALVGVGAFALVAALGLRMRE